MVTQAVSCTDKWNTWHFNSVQRRECGTVVDIQYRNTEKRIKSYNCCPLYQIQCPKCQICSTSVLWIYHIHSDIILLPSKFDYWTVRTVFESGMTYDIKSWHFLCWEILARWTCRHVKFDHLSYSDVINLCISVEIVNPNRFIFATRNSHDFVSCSCFTAVSFHKLSLLRTKSIIWQRLIFTSFGLCKICRNLLFTKISKFTVY